MDKVKVAIVGAGPVGVAALKCFLEEGFSATAFESRSDVGGVWNYDPNGGTTTCLRDTLLNSSRFVSHYSDFPFPPDYPVYPSAPLMHQYFRSYAEHFGLYDHIEFNTKVTGIVRDDKNGKWTVSTEMSDGTKVARGFDKVVLAHGMVHTPTVPRFEGADHFEGVVIHGRDYKSPHGFEKKNVVVVGIGNTAADIAVELAGTASKVYLSHRRGALVLSRFRQGLPVELTVNHHAIRVMNYLEDKLPSVNQKLMDHFTRDMMKKSWETDPTWGLDPAPSMATTLPCVNEQLIPNLAAGSVVSVKGLRRFVGPRSVELDDGTVLDAIDAVVLATGYDSDMTIAPWVETTTPTAHGYAGPPMPRLYLQIFPPALADSAALLNVYNALDCVWVLGELASMAIAQLWSGRVEMPSREHMEASVDAQLRFNARRVGQNPSAERGAVRAAEFYRFMHETAGTGVREALGWGAAGWRFWAREREIARLAGWGVPTPYVLRLVETGRRKAWTGAREAIRGTNKEAKGLDRTVRKFRLDEVRKALEESKESSVAETAGTSL